MHHTIGHELALKRHHLGLRLEDVAAMSGVSIPTVRLIEEDGGTIASLGKVLKAMNLQLRWAGLDFCQKHGQSLAARRKRMGISQRKMAERIGVSHRTSIGLENQFRGRVESLEEYLTIVKLTPVLTTFNGVSGEASETKWQEQLLPIWSTGLHSSSTTVLICGDALDVLRTMPSSSIDCVVTSPPYWLQRTYSVGGLGAELTVEQYLSALRLIFKQVHRVLKSSGSVWLNIDDSYHNKSMQGIPWRLVLAMVEDCRWYIRNDIIWSKTGGSLNRSEDRLGHRHEHVFHLTRNSNYHYDSEAIRQPPKLAILTGKEIVTATGLTKERCLRRIEDATALSSHEKSVAADELAGVFKDVADGKLHDFRMILRGENRITHSESELISARATRINTVGFYFLRYDPRGSLPRDVWTLSPERSRGRDTHYAAYPTELCDIPIGATCPPGGVVLDPFVGTGTSLVVAKKLGRKGIGIDLSQDYLNIAASRLDD